MNLIISINLLLLPCIVFSIEFNREFVGVNFSPYVKKIEDQTMDSCLHKYTLNEVKVMLRVVTTRFSRVATETVGSWNVEYSPRNTYYNSSCIIARTAEAAALINKDNKNKSLSVLIGVMTYNEQPDGINKTLTELNVALEAEQIANEIYPETVEGFQIFVNRSELNDTTGAELSLRWIQFLKSNTKRKHLKIGVITHVQDFEIFDIRHFNNWNMHFKITQPHVQIVKRTDFLNIRVFPSKQIHFNGPTEAFSYIIKPLKRYGPFSDAIHANFEIMETTGWPPVRNNSFQNVEEMETYWSLFNVFALENKKFTIWLDEAFDNPWKKRLQDLSKNGWWKLAEARLANETSSYIEKIAANRKEPKARSGNELNLSLWIGGGVATALILILLLVGIMVHFYRKINSLKQILSYEEIKEFRLGLSDNGFNTSHYGVYICLTAMKKPYDPELEISKDNLIIYWDQLLGSGHFGSVYKALIIHESMKEVAVKTTKRGCPTTALRGLLTEIKILAHLGKHPNIVSLCGAYTAELKAKGKLYVAIELCSMGSLKNHLLKLHSRKIAQYETDSFLPLNLLRWSCEIAAGMEHLGLKGVIHADLATRNILLANDGTAKIADFGLSKRLYDYSGYVIKEDEFVPWKWMAIESLKWGQFSCQSDVWSYGVTLWEIFSLGAEPYAGYSYNTRFIESIEKGSVMLGQPCEATLEIYQVIQDCLCLRPEMRPSFSNLKTRIGEMQGEDCKYDVFPEDAPFYGHQTDDDDVLLFT